MTDIVKRLRQTEEETATIGQELVYLQVSVNPDGPEAADEIERLRTLVHHAFCEGQITSPKLDDWKNSEVYAALKEGK